MGEDPNAGGKVGRNLAKKLAKNTERLADRGTDWLINQMDGHGCGGEIGDGLYAQGRGVRHPKGSQEAKDHMAKLRAMRGKGGSLKGKDGSTMPEEKVELGLAGRHLKAQQRARREQEEREKRESKLGHRELSEEYLGKTGKKKGSGLKKKMKGGAMPPPSRSPVTNEVIAGGLYA
jgi:hypothetical protein